MNSPFIYNSLDLTVSPLRRLPGISGGGNRNRKPSLYPISTLKQVTGQEEADFPYLNINIIRKFLPLAEFYNISRKARGLEQPTTSDFSFLPLYEYVKGNHMKLKQIPAKESVRNGISMDKKRMIAVRGKYGQMRRIQIPLFHTEGPLKGLPTKMHTILILWAFSPASETELKKAARKVYRTFPSNQ